MRAGIIVNVTPEDRRRLEAIVADRSSPQKHVWRARIILATADGCGTFEVMRRSGKAKPVVWRWQERFMQEGVDGLLRDKTRPPARRLCRQRRCSASSIWRSARHLARQPTGPGGCWPRPPASACARSSAFSKPTSLPRTASEPSSCRTTRSSPTSSGISLASTSIRPPMPSSSRSTRRARSRRSTAPSPACP